MGTCHQVRFSICVANSGTPPPSVNNFLLHKYHILYACIVLLRKHFDCVTCTVDVFMTVSDKRNTFAQLYVYVYSQITFKLRYVYCELNLLLLPFVDFVFLSVLLQVVPLLQFVTQLCLSWQLILIVLEDSSIGILRLTLIVFHTGLSLKMKLGHGSSSIILKMIKVLHPVQT